MAVWLLLTQSVGWPLNTAINMSEQNLSISEAQALVDQWIKTIGVRYFNELTNMSILMEEVGELAQATLKCDSENIIKEAIQVAAVAIRIIEESDSTFKNRKEILKLMKEANFEIIESSSFLADNVDEDFADKNLLTNLIGVLAKK